MFGDEITIIGVAGKAELADIEGFVSSRGVDGFEHAVDDTGVVWFAYGVSSQPAVVFLIDDGSYTTHSGTLGVDGLVEGIEELLAS